MTYSGPIWCEPLDDKDRPVQHDIGVALAVLGLSEGRNALDDARRLVKSLDRVGVAFGDMRAWRREFLNGHVQGANEDHRLAGIIADQADEIDRLRAALDAGARPAGGSTADVAPNANSTPVERPADYQGPEVAT